MKRRRWPKTVKVQTQPLLGLSISWTKIQNKIYSYACMGAMRMQSYSGLVSTFCNYGMGPSLAAQTERAALRH